MPDAIKEYSKCHPEISGIPAFIREDDANEYINRYQSTMRRCLNGDFGRTPQYWTEYMTLVDRQQMLHYSVNCNDYDLRMISWNCSLPLCFSMNHVHYARYGTYYLQSLEHIDSTHPGAKEEIRSVGLSIRRNKLVIGQSIDLAGEQSYMQSAKTAGTIPIPKYSVIFDRNHLKDALLSIFKYPLISTLKLYHMVKGSFDAHLTMYLKFQRDLLLQLSFLFGFVFDMLPILVGGVTQFATKENTVRKWVMKRPFQARFAESLMEIAEIDNTMSSTRKCLRQSEVIKSNKMVENIKATLKDHFINPFSQDLDEDQLYNLVSGYPVEEKVRRCLLNMEERGKDKMKKFKERLTKSPADEHFFGPIKREPLTTFKDSSMKTRLKIKGK
eukprot:Seg3338.2 transcript_id=Seg3338.2/GoldUCD/mRNA.D3Y31 product="hypothetical protein" protein_id=Seg3338.2/GoldUCD/D3Y31